MTISCIVDLSCLTSMAVAEVEEVHSSMDNNLQSNWEADALNLEGT